MFEAITHQIQYATMHLSWHALLGLGIAYTFSGLIIWLFGLGMARIAAAVIGGFTGCVIVYVFISVSTIFLTVGAIIGVGIGYAFEAAMVAFVGYGTVAYNLTLAILSALGGTVLFFVGTIFLISLKIARPISHINSHQILYLAAMFAMIVFATIEQLVFCRHKTKAVYEAEVSSPEIDIEPSDRSSWRTK